MLTPTKAIWLNGRFVNWKEARVHILAHSLHYGSGAFEGIRFYLTESGRSAIFRLSDHLSRLADSFAIFGTKLPYSKQAIRNAIIETVKKNLGVAREGYIRPIVFHDYGTMGVDPSEAPVSVAIAVWPWKKYLREVIKVKTSSFIKLHPKSVPANRKVTGFYVNSILASLEAKRAGFDEALLLDYKGNVAEGPGENFFIVADETVKTPRLNRQILCGITRDSVIRIAKNLGYEVEETDLTLGEVKKASEAFMTGTAAEVTPVVQVDDTRVGDGKPGTVTKQLRETYFAAVRGKLPAYENWLTYV